MNNGDMAPEQFRFDGRVALITGGGRGLGRSHALLLASRGARVVINDTGAGTDGTGAASIEPAEQVVEEIITAGGEAVANGDTVATSEGGRAMVERAIDTWGRLDIVVHNAGISSPFHGFDMITDDQLRRVVDTHLVGAFNVLRPAWSVMEQAAYGRLVLTASAQALGDDYNFDYCAAKGGVVSLARSLAVAGADKGIKANVVMPVAWTRLSGLVPDSSTKAWLESNFQPEQVSQAVAWLSHDQVPVTGETFSVGGGRVARVFFGIVPGYRSNALTPEKLQTAVDEVMDVSHFAVATSATSEAAFMPSGSA